MFEMGGRIFGDVVDVVGNVGCVVEGRSGVNQHTGL